MTSEVISRATSFDYGYRLYNFPPINSLEKNEKLQSQFLTCIAIPGRSYPCFQDKIADLKKIVRDRYDSAVLFDEKNVMEKIFLFDDNYILPLYLVTLGNNLPQNSSIQSENQKNILFEDDEKKQVRDRRHNLIAPIKKFGFRFTRFPDHKNDDNNNKNNNTNNKNNQVKKEEENLIGKNQKWILTLSPSILQNKFGIKTESLTPHLQVIYLIDKSRFIGDKFTTHILPTCDSLHNRLNADSSHAILFGNYVDHFVINSGNFFTSNEIKGTTLEYERKLSKGYGKAVDVVYQSFIKYMKKQEELLMIQDFDQSIKDKRIKTMMNNAAKKLSFVFIYFSNGKGKESEKEIEEINEQIDSTKKIFKTNKILTMFKVIEIGKSVNTKISLELKKGSETISSLKSRPVYIGNNIENLNIITNEITNELKDFQSHSISHYEKDLLKGFIENFTKSPSSTINFRLKSQSKLNAISQAEKNLNENNNNNNNNKIIDDDQIVYDDCQISLLYEGIPPKELELNGIYYPVYFSNKIAPENSILELLKGFSADIKSAILSSRESIQIIEKYVKTLKEMINRIKRNHFQFSTFNLIPPQMKAEFMHKKKKLINELENIFNKLVDCFLFSKSQKNSDQDAIWLKQASNMKFGGKILRIIEKKKASVEDNQNSPSSSALLPSPPNSSFSNENKDLISELNTNIDKKIKNKANNNKNNINKLLINNNQNNNNTTTKNEKEITTNSVCESLKFFQKNTIKEYISETGLLKITKKETDFKSNLSNKTAAELLQEFIQSRFTITPKDSLDQMITDLLYAYGMIGNYIQVFRTESSNIDPWNLIVDFVSPDKNDSASALCSLHGGISINDPSYDQPAEDVLVLIDPRNPIAYELWIRSVPLHKHYLAVVFTRNPEIVLPSQYPSILMISLVKSIEQMMLNAKYRTIPFIESIFHIIFTLREIIFKGKYKEYWVSMLKKLSLENPAKYMTESEEDDIKSVVKLIAPIICLSDAKKLFNIDKNLNNNNESENRLPEIALSLIAESVSRNARVLLKTKSNNNGELPSLSRSFIQKALKISLDEEKEFFVENYNLNSAKEISEMKYSKKFDLSSARRYSSKFFRRKFQGTNCNPYSVVASIEFASILHSTLNSDLDLLDSTLKSGNTDQFFSQFLDSFSKVSMKSFITKYSPDSDPMIVQIALYLQGIKFYNSSLRKNSYIPSITLPNELIEAIVEDERKKIYMDNLQKYLHEFRSNQKDEQRKIKTQIQLTKQNEFLEIHEFPKIFTYDEIEKLNRNRPANDQLNLLPSGLLEHHCAAEKCAFYLHNFATQKDRKFNSRRGIMQHLKYYFVPKKAYFKGFHSILVPMLKRCSTKEIFLTNGEELILGNNSNVSKEEKERLVSLLNKFWDNNKKP